MAIEKIHIEQFLSLANDIPVLDVRSPSEFRQAHIPGAYSLPLFSDEERKVVGTAYKQESRQVAIKIGLDFFGPKMRAMVEEVERLIEELKQSKASNATLPGADPARSKTVVVHCWRGGMRSAGVAWLLDLYGFRVYTLAGGYKSFRNWVLKKFEEPYPFLILGGFTGSGKTETLKEIKRMTEPVIDLEALAGHKGSAFGNIGLPQQPSQEMFENRLGIALHRVQAEKSTGSTRIWLEDESQRIGTVNIPQPIWRNMRASPVYFLDISFDERLDHLVEEYGTLDRQKMLEAIIRLQKRLGGLETKTAIAHLELGEVRECFSILLKYYDKYYKKGLMNREHLDKLLTSISCTGMDASVNAAAALRTTQLISIG